MSPSFAAETNPPEESFEGTDVIIGDICYVIKDVFDTTIKQEDTPVFRLANSLHINTRRSTISSQLLFRSGELYSKQAISESARLLRQNRYLYDASIQVVRRSDSVVDVCIVTRDNWSLLPTISLSRNGGSSSRHFGIEDQNFLGTGSSLKVQKRSDETRDSRILEFFDRNIGRSWVSLALVHHDNDDGHKRQVRVDRPFFSVNTRWSAGAEYSSRDRKEPLYSYGDEVTRYRQRDHKASLWFGWSSGLVKNMTERWTFGIRRDDSEFTEDAGFTPVSRFPATRRFVYPFIQFERLEDRYTTARNLNNIALTEDVHLGEQFSFSIGHAASSWNDRRSGWLFASSYRTSYGTPANRLFQIEATTSGRLESGAIRGMTLMLRSTYHQRTSNRASTFASLRAIKTWHPDIDQVVRLGGKTGLRGYPTAFGNGDASLLLTLERRFFTTRYPFRLFRLGAATYLDAGRVWGTDATGRRERRLLSNLGFGLRLANTRGTRNRVIHLDVALPLGDSRVDSMQFILEAKSGF